MSNVSEDAWALLALKSAPTSPSRSLVQKNGHPDKPIAKLETVEFEYMIRQKRIVIGRKSNNCHVDVDMGNSSFISRRHIEIYYESPCFYLICNGKNGVFVNGYFIKKSGPPLRLPRTCQFRFPSTSIRLLFQSLVEEDDGVCPPKPNSDFMMKAHNMAPLKVNIPDPDFASPMPSPTGTISAANSCPTSPRSNSRYNDLQVMVAYAAAAVNKDEDQKQQIQSQIQQDNQLTADQPNSEIQIGGSLQLSQQNTISSVLRNSQESQNSSMSISSSQTSNPDEYYRSSNTPIGSVGANEHVTTITNICSNNSIVNSLSTDDSKPLFSYAQLIAQAISTAPNKQLTLSGIYQYITQHYPYYRTAEKGWQNSIRHNLSLSRHFVKVARAQEEPGKGSFWRIDPPCEAKLIESAFKPRRQPRPSNCYTNQLSSRSAPASPNHLHGLQSGNLKSDSMSREPSPSPEIVDSTEHSLMGPPTASFLTVPSDYKMCSKSAPGSPGSSSISSAELQVFSSGQAGAQFLKREMLANAGRNSSPRAIAVDNNTVILQTTIKSSHPQISPSNASQNLVTQPQTVIVQGPSFSGVVSSAASLPSSNYNLKDFDVAGQPLPNEANNDNNEANVTMVSKDSKSIDELSGTKDSKSLDELSGTDNEIEKVKIEDDCKEIISNVKQEIDDENLEDDERNELVIVKRIKRS